MIYKVIGLMSGSSLDGLDIIYTTISDARDNWEFEIEHSACITFPEALRISLQKASSLPVSDFLQLHTSFGRYLGEQVNAFIEKNQLQHKVHFIVSHGHTAYHNPSANTSFQLGDGASITAITNLTTISDLRNMDVALNGQGAPIVPIADKYLFKNYDFCLNLGGIMNITIKKDNEILAFDIGGCNQILNHFAEKKHLKFDDRGQLATSGKFHKAIFDALNEVEYFQKPAPKSLSNDFTPNNLLTKLEDLNIEDALYTACKHIAYQIKQAITPYTKASSTKILVTGGGAHNHFLITSTNEMLVDTNVTLEIPNDIIVDNKEALAMAFFGILRWREQTNTIKSVTGATQDSIGGAIWIPNN